MSEHDRSLLQQFILAQTQQRLLFRLLLLAALDHLPHHALQQWNALGSLLMDVDVLLPQRVFLVMLAM